MEVWQEILEDEDKGARRLVAEYKDRLVAVASFFAPNPAEAEDLVFQTFLKAIRNIRQHRPESSFYGWIHSILLNFCRSAGRKASRSPLVLTPELPECEDPQATPLEKLIQETDAAMVKGCVARLPLAMRETVVLRYFEEMQLTEIAGILEIPVGTVKSRLHEAKIALRGFLASCHKNEGGER